MLNTNSETPLLCNLFVKMGFGNEFFLYFKMSGFHGLRQKGKYVVTNGLRVDKSDGFLYEGLDGIHPALDINDKSDLVYVGPDINGHHYRVFVNGMEAKGDWAVRAANSVRETGQPLCLNVSLVFLYRPDFNVSASFYMAHKREPYTLFYLALIHPGFSVSAITAGKTWGLAPTLRWRMDRTQGVHFNWPGVRRVVVWAGDARVRLLEVELTADKRDRLDMTAMFALVTVTQPLLYVVIGDFRFYVKAVA